MSVFTTTNSSNKIKTLGDINTSGGQLGQTVIATLSSDINQVTNFDDIYSNYVLNMGGSDRTMTMAIIGNSLTVGELQPGYTCVIKNSDSTNSLIIEDSTNTTITTVSFNRSVKLVAINNTPTWEIVRLGQSEYDAIIPDDFPLLSSAITAGNRNVFMRNGLYSEPASIAIPTNMKITGESQLGTIIDFGGNSSSFDINNGATVDETGTVALTVGSTTVTGTGTTFTAGMVGRYLNVGNFWYEIASFTSATVIDLTNSWRGNATSGTEYIIADIFQNIKFHNFTIRNSTSQALNITALGNSQFSNLYIFDTNGVITTDSAVIKFLECVIDNNFSGGSSDDCLNMVRSSSIYVDNCNMQRAVDEGIGIFSSLTQLARNIKITNCICNNNTASGIFISGNLISISNCVSNNNGNNGFLFNQDSDNCSVTTCQAYENAQSGFNTIASGLIAKNNTIDGCFSFNNTDDGFEIQASGMLVTNNQSRNNGRDGIRIATNVNNCIVNGNIVESNTTRGVFIEAATCNNNIASNNRLIGNGAILADNFVDNGTGTVTNGDNLSTV